MPDVGPFLWLIPALPLAASALIGLAGPRLLRGYSHWPCILAIAGSCLISVWVLRAVAQAPDGAEGVARYYTWFQIAGLDVGVTLRADALTAIMLVTVTFIATLIAVYSVGYMHGDPGYPRYFAEIALFVFSMTGLVLADNFLLLYAFWEGVGLCSYLLIGFWFTKPAAAAAARKAFLVTRIGDLGFILGIILLWLEFGHRLDYGIVFDNAAGVGEVTLTAICLLLFCGAVGKSAQFPLHVWLPDAMEGPSPVSALIHAATMVTAGVYMVARCMPLFALAPTALLVVAIIGAFTALLTALIALTQNDLKRVLAYSTISQLGYMFLALGSGVTTDLVTVAVIAAIFHLFTHAFFKALLFLAAGSVMHAMGNVIDMRRLGGLRTIMPATHWTFLCGALALAGFPLFSGFWSKDEILGAAWSASHQDRPYREIYLLLFLIGLVTAGLTAFYTFRAYFRTFWGTLRVPPEAGEHAHESPAIMTAPLKVLAVGAAFVGIVVEPFTHFFSAFLTRTPRLGHLHGHHLDWVLMSISAAVALAGIYLAYAMYVRQPELPGRLARAVHGLYELSLNKFRLDEIYGYLIVQPLSAIARICRAVDTYVVDSLVDLVGQAPRYVGVLLRPMQNGLVQFYALAMVMGLLVILLAFVRALAG
jgi:NADH-quinone oxidoreductase subunit L